MREDDYKRKVVAELKTLKAWVYCPTDTMRKGIPDIIACTKRMVAIELKYSDDIRDGVVHLHHSLTSHQSKSLRDICASGGVGYLLVGHSGGKCTIVPANSLRPGKTTTVKHNEMEIADAIKIIIRSKDRDS